MTKRERKYHRKYWEPQQHKIRRKQLIEDSINSILVGSKTAPFEIYVGPVMRQILNQQIAKNYAQ